MTDLKINELAIIAQIDIIQRYIVDLYNAKKDDDKRYILTELYAYEIPNLKTMIKGCIDLQRR